MPICGENAAVYIDKWLVGYSLLLGAVGGVLIADYIVLRRTQLDQAGLYKQKGPYWYAGGFNPAAIIALVLGIAVALPGFLVHLGYLAMQGDPKAPPDLLAIPAFFAHLYNYAWFASFGVAFLVYLLLMLPRRARMQT